MTYKDLKNKIKEEQKALALKIRELKSKRKETLYGYVEGLEYKQDDYRHIHIAYCQFFNKTDYGMIENFCHVDPRTSTIEMYMKNWESELDEALCCGA